MSKREREREKSLPADVRDECIKTCVCVGWLWDSKHSHTSDLFRNGFWRTINEKFVWKFTQYQACLCEGDVQILITAQQVFFFRYKQTLDWCLMVDRCDKNSKQTLTEQHCEHMTFESASPEWSGFLNQLLGQCGYTRNFLCVFMCLYICTYGIHLCICMYCMLRPCVHFAVRVCMDECILHVEEGEYDACVHYILCESEQKTSVLTHNLDNSPDVHCGHLLSHHLLFTK